MTASNWIVHMPEPILYVTKDDVPEATVEALIQRNVTRIAGEDLVENAIAFSKYKDKETNFGWGLDDPGHGLSFVSTETPELALAGAPFAHLGKHAPVLWLEEGEVAESLYSYLGRLKPMFEDDPTTGPYNHAFMLGTADTIPFRTQGVIDERLEIVQENGMDHGGH
jgi:hypothetical protein